ncbi:ComEC/Rec2 family competence protein [Marinomonas ostreistagni]|uniref:ComEC/Rec2 family competence protein n=1 Tax=Marinomonas ostreistagni TaxID=359209 RepID=UPI00194E51A3|nr:ComEC/Rec2 family competence protein [Marinomonas ostreistagni]MBM6549985.1 ComEC/Rec2 family competence protein [Marinomonas ostreistagni]
MPSHQCFIGPSEANLNYVLIKAQRRDLYLTPCDAGRSFNQAQSISVTLTLADLQGSRLARFAYGKGVDALGYANAIPKNMTTMSDAQSRLSQFASWRFAYSIIKGERTQWDQRDQWWVNYLGITHLFVVSGLHVGFVCLLALCVVRGVWWLWPSVYRYCGRRVVLEWWAAVPACFVYAQWSGAGEPAVRAALMALCFMSLRVLFHKISLGQILLSCAWLMLIMWPGRLIDASFWLSFGFVGLLVLCVSKLPKLGKGLYLQALLSVFALLFTLGWQGYLSSLTLFINLLLVPFVAFVWFPVSLASLAEANLFGTVWLYSWLDFVLMWGFSYIEPVLFYAPDVLLRSNVAAGLKLVCIVLALAGVLWLPLRNAWLLLIGACVVASLMNIAPTPEFQWQRYGHQFVQQSSRSGLQPVVRQTIDGHVGLFNPRAKDIGHLALQQDWSFALLSEGHKDAVRLRALGVVVLEVAEGEQILLYRNQTQWRVQSSNCYQLLNLLKTVACEHAESLESVLN